MSKKERETMTTNACKRNPVARHSRKVNRAQVHIDRKKAAQRGARRHKKHWGDTKAA